MTSRSWDRTGSIHPASLYVALTQPPMFVEAGDLRLAVSTIDLSGAARSDVPVTVSLAREEWVPVRQRDLPGAPIRWERREIPAGEWNVETANDETPVVIPVQASGRFLVRATARDAAGRPTRTDAAFYGLGTGRTSWRSTGNGIELVPERTTWKPGERARILIQSPWDEATALLTTEREGVRSHRRFAISSTHDTVEVPITEDDVPNVFVSVLLVKGRTGEEPAGEDSDPGRPSYRIGYTELTVDDSSRRLRVDVAADAAEYRPRQPLAVSVGVTAPDGAPVRGEVTLWAVDYGLLSLTGYTVPDVVKAIHAPKALQVMTLDNRLRLIRRQVLSASPDVPPAGNLERVALARMGMRAGPGAAGVVFDAANAQRVSFQLSGALGEREQPADPSVEIRDDFRPLVFWLGSATTDARGQVATMVRLPDSLTTYRIIAVAGDPLSRFGFGEHDVRVAKRLTLLPAFPRFLSVGDRATFGAVVTNSGTVAGDAVVTIESLDSGALRTDGSASRSVRLEPGASTHVSFDAAAEARGAARVRMVARLGDETDAFELPLVVTAPLRDTITAAYGETTGTAVEQLSLPADILHDAGGLTVSLASSALIGLGESARYLTEYPYEYAEPIASRALALLLASELSGTFELPDVEPANYRDEGEGDLRRLSAYQCGSGGFSLYAGRCNLVSPYLTAYVLHVMRVAGTLGVALDRPAIERALNYLQEQLRQPPPDVRWHAAWGASQAYSVKVLAEHGRDPSADIDRLVSLAEQLPVFALSHLADALSATGDRAPRYEDIVRRITNALRIEADRAHVEEIDEDALFWLWNTNTRATAVVLDGIVRRQDEATFVAPLVRWLLAARTDGRWGTTHENAMALEALVAYYRAFERESPQMTVTVRMGRTTTATETFDGRSTATRQVDVSMRDLAAHFASAGSPELSISREGTGRVHYTARVHTVSLESPEAEDRGFTVERHYEPYVQNGRGEPRTSFNAGDLVRVVVRVTVRGEGRYLALTDPIPAAFEPIDGWLRTTASDLAAEATRVAPGGSDWLAALRYGTFTHLERHDDRVVAFATRLTSGTHELSYLVRATTAGTFSATGAQVEAMYAAELTGRSTAATVEIAPR
jgi:uncharacterized protein YfaS (alpha-2-macroglobulin family)